MPPPLTAVGRAPRCHRGLAVTASAAGAGAADGHPWGHPSLGPWERLQLARRKLEVAVAEEDYRLAAEAKREAEALHARLPANLALMASAAAGRAARRECPACCRPFSPPGRLL